MNLLSDNGFSPMTQTETLQAIREITEYIAQQNQNTQLIIIIVMILMIFAFVMYFGMRGGFAIFSRLGSAIDKLADTEAERHETQKKLVVAVEAFTTQNENRYQKVDEIWQSVLDGQKKINERIDNLQKAYEENPRNERTYEMLLKIYNALDTAKEQTDELEAIKDE